ncbi:MAG: hypothetical protein AAGE59_37630 [Cyanobacteria bacterium P01_F01_bin.86]
MSLTLATFNVRNLIEAGKTIYNGQEPTYSKEGKNSEGQSLSGINEGTGEPWR